MNKDKPDVPLIILIIIVLIAFMLTSDFWLAMTENALTGLVSAIWIFFVLLIALVILIVGGFIFLFGGYYFWQWINRNHPSLKNRPKNRGRGYKRRKRI